MSNPTQDNLRSRVESKFNTARTLWAAAMLAGAIAIGVLLPPWYLVLLVPIGIATYMLLLVIVSLIIAGNLSEEELEEINRANAETAAEEENPKLHAILNEPPLEGETSEQLVKKLNDVGIHDVTIIESKGPVVGRYLDKDIYEYIVIKRQGENETHTYPYFGPAEVKGGIPQIPVFDDMDLTCVDGILYCDKLP